VSGHLEFLRHLHALDVPIFTAEPGVNGSEFTRPSGWQQLDPAGNAARIKTHRHGHALGGVMGGRVAVVDVDTKNGADADSTRRLLDELGVTVYGDVATPSGGRHFYVAGHPELPTVHAAAGRDGLVGHPGVEVISFGANVFLPGTVRPKYDGAGYTVTVDNLAALADGGDPDGAEALAGWVAVHRVHVAEDFEPAPPWDGTPPDKRQSAYLRAVLDSLCNDLAAMRPNSGRNVALYTAALKCGSFVAGAGMREWAVVDRLSAAASACGLTQEDGPRSVESTIRSGLRNGRREPRAVPPERELVVLDDDAADTMLAAALAFNRAVSEEAYRPRVREAAARIVRLERAGALAEPELVSLKDFLALEDEPLVYRVDQLWPIGDRMVAAAQFRAGKTTLRDNLVRALADGGPFLGRFDVAPPAGRIVVFDNELDKRMLRRWMREQGIVNEDRVELVPLRGKVATFNLIEEDCRARWAEKIRAAVGSVVVLDCLRPVLDALGLSEDKDAGRFLVAFDALLAEAGAPEGVVTHHMGHNGERSLGDSRILDWPDATWKLVREKVPRRRGRPGRAALLQRIRP
jgi:hypothetical protein